MRVLSHAFSPYICKHLLFQLSTQTTSISGVHNWLSTMLSLILDLLCLILVNSITLPLFEITRDGDLNTTGQSAGILIKRPLESTNPSVGPNSNTSTHTFLNSTTLSPWSIICYGGRSIEQRLPTRKSSECDTALLKILEGVPEEQYRDPVSWSSPWTWKFESCVISLLPELPGYHAVFSRMDIVATAGLIQARCGGPEGGHRRIDSPGLFTVTLSGAAVPLPNRHLGRTQIRNMNNVSPPRDSLNAALMHNSSYLTDTPTCFPPPPPGEPPNPIGEVSDCLGAISRIRNVIDPTVAIPWGLGVSWIYDTCVVTLHRERRQGYDFFAATDVSASAEAVFLQCINRLHGFRGGFVSIGSRRIFTVEVSWRRLAPTIDLSNRSLPVNDNIQPSCWPPRRFAPIANPIDCGVAIDRLIESGDPREFVLWTGRYIWTYRTCRIELIPTSVSSREYMTRSAIGWQAAAVLDQCVTADHGYRGGYIMSGISGVFEVTMWASTTTTSASKGEVMTRATSVAPAPDKSLEGSTSPPKEFLQGA